MRYPEIPEIITPRLLLRKLRLADTEAYFLHLGSSEAVTRHMLFNPHRQIGESRASIEKSLSRYARGGCYRWAVTLRENDTLIGVFELLRFDEYDGSCSFAYMLGQDFWNRGYGTEAMKAAFRFAFRELGAEIIRADHMAENPASGAVMRKAGMRFIGIVPEKYEKNGILHDACCYEIRRSENHDCQ